MRMRPCHADPTYSPGGRIPAVKPFYIMLVFCLLLTTLLSEVGNAGGGPRAGSKPLDDAARMQISPGDRCPVCAMQVDRHRKFASAIQLQDATTYYFCGTGCMLRSWLHPEIFLGVDRRTLQLPVVREYFSGRETDARRVIWVAGSDIVGPMGPTLVPVKDEVQLKVFKQRHGAQTVFRMSDLDDALWLKIKGKKAPR